MSDYSKEYEPIDNIQCSLGAIEGELDGIRNSINLLIEQYENRKEQINKDAVSREAAKKLYCNICMNKNICYRDKEHCQELKLFDNLPPVTPKQRWIPCSERLPKLEQKVLVHVINVDNVEYDVACLKDTKHAAYDEDYHWEGKFAYGLKSVIEWKLIESEVTNG